MLMLTQIRTAIKRITDGDRLTPANLAKTLIKVSLLFHLRKTRIHRIVNIYDVY